MVVLLVLTVTIVPVVLAQRLTRDTGALRRGAPVTAAAGSQSAAAAA